MTAKDVKGMARAKSRARERKNKSWERGVLAADCRPPTADWPLLLGAHMSIQGGLHRAIERARKDRCTALQLFTANNLRWHPKAPTEDDAARFRQAWAESGIGPVVAHAGYLIDLGTPEERILGMSLVALVAELRRAAAIGVPWVVLHPGCHKGSGEEAGLRRIAESASRALEATSVGLLLETTAGQGTALGYRFEQLAWLLRAIEPAERVGVCFDTCHVFAAGYDLRTPVAYAATMREFERVVGLGRIHAIHVNDSKGELGGRLDRHAHIGHGRLGLDAFRCLLRDPRLARIPKLLETPKRDKKRKDWDPVNLATLRRLAEGGKRGP